jgi:rod shape-determining protein MreB
VLRHYGILIGENTAEEIKLNIGCVAPRPDMQQMVVKGRDVQTGLAKEAVVTSEDMLEALRRPARQIADEVADVLRQITPELVSDIQRNGIVLTGGGSQLWGMDLLIQERTGMKCMLADDADSCVAYGCGRALEWMNRMQEGTINIARRRQLKD